MPTRVYKRLWCKVCNDYKLHEPKELFKEPLVCGECDTIYIKTKLSEIPPDKMELQRKRYNQAQINSRNSIIFSPFLFGLNSFGFNDGFDVRTIEDDAGQQYIDNQNRIQSEKLREERRIKRQENLILKKSYHKLGRNDKCLCGSNLKYKKCCYRKIDKI